MSRFKKTKRTSNLHWALWFYRILDALLTYGPFIFYGVKCFASAQPVQRLALSATLIISMFLCILQILYKKRWRSLPWVLLLGFCFVMTKIYWAVILIAACTLLDELFVVPMLKRTREKYVINKEIDRRG